MNTQPPATAPAGLESARGAALPVNTPQGWISHSLRDLERWVAWSIAAYSAWLGLSVFAGVPAIWFFVLYAGLIGKWAELNPSRYQGEMTLRGLALIAGAYALHTHSSELGGPGGPLFFWLSITCLAYTFMLKPAWGALLIGAAAIEFAAASFQLEPGAVSLGAMAQTALASAFPLLLAMKFGAAMRRPDDALEGGRIDGATSLYNKAGLLAHGDELLAAGRRERRPVSMAVFDCADLLEVRSIYGSRVARKVMARVVKKLDAVAAGTGLAARTGPAEFAIVLPGIGRDKAIAAIQRVLGKPGRIEFDAGDDEIVLVPSFAVQTVEAGGESAQELYDALRGELTRIDEAEQRRQHYLQRERERHSRPMGISALASQSAAKPRPARVQLSKTLPAPLVVN